jgi:hypothetical protein
MEWLLGKRLLSGRSKMNSHTANLDPQTPLPDGNQGGSRPRLPVVATSFLSRYWAIWLIIALIVYETTSQPALAAMFACVKVGWDDFSLAHWLYRVDSNRKGAILRSVVYVSWGMAKIALTATLVMAATITIMDLLRWAGQPWIQLIRALWGALVALLVGMTLSGGATLIAAILAWASGQKLYVGNAVARAREGSYWPPINTNPTGYFMGGGNRVSWLLALSWLLTMTFGGVYIQIVIAKQAPNRMIARQKASPWILALGGGTVLAYFYLGRKVIAQNPQECWSLPEWAEFSGDSDAEPFPEEWAHLQIGRSDTLGSSGGLTDS